MYRILVFSLLFLSCVIMTRKNYNMSIDLANTEGQLTGYMDVHQFLHLTKDTAQIDSFLTGRIQVDSVFLAAVKRGRQ